MPDDHAPFRGEAAADLQASVAGEGAARNGRAVWSWLAVVLGAWTVVHTLNWVVPITTQATHPALALLWWLPAKFVAWVLPTVILARGLVGGRWRAWLGIETLRGLGAGVLWSCAWVGFQSAGVALRLPLFVQPPPEYGLYVLLGPLLVGPVLEELLFRGAMLRALRDQGWGRHAAVAASAVGFALLHVPGWLFRRGFDPAIATSFVSITFFGIILGYLGWRVPSLWAPVVLHFANNFWSTGLLGRLLAAAH